METSDWGLDHKLPEVTSSMNYAMIQWWSKQTPGCCSSILLIHQHFPAQQNKLEQPSNFQAHHHKQQYKASVIQPVISCYISFLNITLFYDPLMLFPNSPICSSPNSTIALNYLILIAFISLTSFSVSLPCRGNQPWHLGARLWNSSLPSFLVPCPFQGAETVAKGEEICSIWSMTISGESKRIASTAGCKSPQSEKK